MLVIDSVSVSFLGRNVLSGCYLHCSPNEVVGLLGRNGSGKSTLLKVIFGSQQPDFKHLRIDERIICQAYAEGKVAYLPQQPFLLPFMKVREALSALPARTLEELLDLGDFHSKIDNNLGTLSQGEQRIVECLWALHRPADYILLDEPFSAIAPLFIEFLQSVIRKQAATKGIILTDHLYRPLLQVADRIVLLHNNAIYSIKDPGDLVQYNYLPE